MDVKLIVTRSCSHCKNFSKELDELGVQYSKLYVEDETDLCQSLEIRTSPNLVVNGEVVFRRQPTEKELRSLFDL